MSKAGVIVVLGFLVAFLPFTGFPSGFEITLEILFGLAIMFLGFLVRQERLWLLRSMSGEVKSTGFAESRPSQTQNPELSEPQD